MLPDREPNRNIPCTTCWGAGADLNAQLTMRQENYDVVLDLALAGRPVFLSLVLTLDHAITFNLLVIGEVARSSGSNGK
jgi:hypothetical protein